MRIKVLVIIFLLVTVSVTSALLISDKTLSSAERTNITQVCSGCHGGVPTYETATYFHNKHSVLECNFCHSDRTLKTTLSFHQQLEGWGIGLILLTTMGIVANLVIIQKRGKVKR